MSQQAASTSSWARPLIVVWVLGVVPVCVLCAYTILYYVDPSIPSKQEYLEGAMMGAAWAVPAVLIMGITGWRKRAHLRAWHKAALAIPVVATAAAVMADLLHGVL
jgi:hypothetical protein